MLECVTIAKHDHNGTYQRKEVCEQMHITQKNINENLQYQVADNRKEISSIKRKIDATLVGVIGILVTLVFTLASIWLH
jgi:uncharacterized membrane protein YvbJ